MRHISPSTVLNRFNGCVSSTFSQPYDQFCCDVTCSETCVCFGCMQWCGAHNNSWKDTTCDHDREFHRRRITGWSRPFTKFTITSHYVTTTERVDLGNRMQYAAMTTWFGSVAHWKRLGPNETAFALLSQQISLNGGIWRSIHQGEIWNSGKVLYVVLYETTQNAGYTRYWRHWVLIYRVAQSRVGSG